jgi:SMC interacting uncharacterized protein involved in chromosome segregation
MTGLRRFKGEIKMKFDELYEQVFNEMKECKDSKKKIEECYDSKKKMKECKDSKKEIMTEDKVKSKADLKEYAMAKAEAIFGNETDESKVDAIVDNAIEKSTDDGETDWSAAAGIVQSSF